MNRNCFKPILPCLSVFVAVLAVAQWHSTVDASLKTGRVENEFWEEAIQKFEAGDRQSPPPKNGILFIGGSKIRRRKIEDDFSYRPGLHPGVGGSMISAARYYPRRGRLPRRA